MANVWPQDVGITLEGQSPSFEYLHSRVSWGHPHAAAFEVDIFNRNATFALGQVRDPPTSCFCPFIVGLTGREAFEKTLSAKLWLVAAMYNKKPLGKSALHVVLLGCEVLRLGWPIREISRGLLAHRNHTYRCFNKVVRACGVWLRRNRRHVDRIRLLGPKEEQVWAALADEWIEEAGFGPSLAGHFQA
jgi:hypothetical protein